MIGLTITGTLMAESAIYICTKNRLAYVTKCLQQLDETLYESRGGYGSPQVAYVVSETQYQADIKHLFAIWNSFEVKPVWLKSQERGLGYARNRAVAHASSQGYKSIGMIDDDQLLKGDIAGWLAAAKRDDITSLGAYKRIYGLFFGASAMVAHKDEPGVWLHKGNAGNMAVALNVANVIEIGNYGQDQRYMEDHELCRNNYAKRGCPWFIYTGVHAGDIGTMKETRAQAGGMTAADRSLEARAKIQQMNHETWPEYVTAPPKRYRCNWRKMIEDCTNIATWPLEDIRTDEPWDWQDA